MRRALALVVTAAALAGCGGEDDGGYPKASVDAFVAQCRAQPDTTAQQCRCVIGRLQGTLPYEQFARADAALQANGQPDPVALERLRAAVDACS